MNFYQRWKFKRLVRKLLKQGRALNPWWRNQGVPRKISIEEMRKLWESCTKEGKEK